MNSRPGLILSLFISCVSFSALAEQPVLTVQPEAELVLLPLADQTLTESTTVTVQPRDAGSPAGALSEPLPSHCLLSVHVALGGGQAELSPGKMICITDDHRILEAQVQADINELGECQGSGCGRYRLSAGQNGQLRLTAPVEFQLQPRNLGG